MSATKVLVVDDEPALLGEICQLLHGRGYRVYRATNGVEAIRLIVSERPDVVITDIILPESDGIEVARRAREMVPDAKIIAISGGGRLRTRDLLQLAERVGADTALYKPISAITLLRAIEGVHRPAARTDALNVVSIA